MTAIGVIPARWGASRFPGKILTTLHGEPLIVWVMRRVAQAQALDAWLVATDDERIRDVVQEHGGEAVMTRADHPSGTDRIAEAVADRDCDVVINIQGDEPLIDPALIDRLVERMRADPDLDMATAACALPIQDVNNPNAVKVVCRDDGDALYFSRSPVPCVRDSGEGFAGYLRHIGIYAYRYDFLRRFVDAPPAALELAEKLEQLRALAMGARVHVLTTADTSVGVDTPDDVASVERLLRDASA